MNNVSNTKIFVGRGNEGGIDITVIVKAAATMEAIYLGSGELAIEHDDLQSFRFLFVGAARGLR